MGMVVGLTLAQPSESMLGELVASARRGERAAFAELHSRFHRMVHAILIARVPAQAADDLVQDVFLSALEKLDGLVEPDAFGGWLAQIARNRALDHLRTKKIESDLPLDLPARGRTDAKAEAAQALAAIRALPEAYRETMMMRLVEGMSGPEIAAQTGLTAASVRVNLHRGMKLLREKLGMEQRDA
jgi:RNA polymerase sigma-70 factor, ECF subfamily